MHAADTRPCDHVEGPLEGLLVLVREAHDHVGREVDVRDRLAQLADRLQVLLGAVVAPHRLEHAVVPGLERHV